LGPLWLIDHKQIFMSKLRRIMPTREYYLQQAKVLFELASKMSLKVDAERLIVRANEYQILASAFPADDPQGDDLPVTPPATPQMVAQPMQQQQQHGTGDDEDKQN